MKYIRLFPNASIRDAVLAEIEHSVLSYTEGEGMLLKPVSITPQPNDEIWYTSTDSNIVNPNTVAFGTGITVVSNTYSNGKGVIKLSGDATTIGLRAFTGCTTLLTITIPDSVTDLGAYAFRGCDHLTSINRIPNVTIIPDSCFSNCASLESITIPNSVITLENEAFHICSSLTSVIIPSNVTTINSAFNMCEGLNSITCLPINPPSLNSKYSLYGTNECPIYVPASSVDTYKTANYWSEYASRIQAIQ